MPVQAQRASTGMALPICNLVVRWGWVDGTLRPPYPLERAPVPIVLEAGWAPGWTRTSVEKREPLASSGVRFSDRPVRNESIYRLRHHPHRLKYYTGISRTGLWKTTKILGWWFVCLVLYRAVESLLYVIPCMIGITEELQ